MSCCGSQRAALRRDPEVFSQRTVQHWNPGAISFEYVGAGELSVTGPLTGTVYRFARGTGPVRVHASDAASLAAVAGLKPVR